jgi:hypothetical protein
MCMLVESDWKPGDCFMSIGNNTSALGWIQKSNFNPIKVPEQVTHMALSRYMTVLLAEMDVVQFGQWLPGTDNGIADALSRRHIESDAELTKFIVASYPLQTPPGFQIHPLPPAVTLWVRYWLHHEPGTKESPPELFPSRIRAGNDGSSSCTRVNSTTTSSLHNSRDTNDISSSAHSHNRSGTMNGQNPRKDMITCCRVMPRRHRQCVSGLRRSQL